MASPDFKPGSWGFAYGSNKYPDSDDTAMVIKALLPYTKQSNTILQAVRKLSIGFLQMQNADGGFPAWDFNATENVEYMIKHTTMLPNTSPEPRSRCHLLRVLRSLKHLQASGQDFNSSKYFTDRGCSFLTKTPPTPVPV